MLYVSEPQSTAPENFKTPLQEKVYAALNALQIPFWRVDTDEAITMEDCVRISEKLQMKMVKTLFLCNRQHTAFYLFITTDDKPFSSKEFSAAMGVSRVSFASPELMLEKLGTKVGAATVFGALHDTANEIQIVFDEDVLKEKWYGCSDGTTTGYMKLETEKVLHTLLPYTKHEYKIIHMD